MTNSSVVLRGLGASFVFSAVVVAGASTAGAATFTPLTLQNGWTTAPFGNRNAGVSLVSGIVEFDGAIASGNPNVPAFTLPVGLRPSTDAYVPVDMCNATKASFGPSAAGFTALALQNGWTNAPFSTSNAAVENIGGIVHFKGAIASGNASPFTLPAGFVPAQDVYVAVDLCGATNGRLLISGGSGIVTVQAENGALANAQCFTSLDGASFVLGQGGSTGLGLLNGWFGAPFGTRGAAAIDLSGIVHLSGAIATGAGNATAFTLPAALAPATNVYVPVDLCNATKGRLVISAGSGTVSVQPENGTFSNAQCFTSLDGAFYAL